MSFVAIVLAFRFVVGDAVEGAPVTAATAEAAARGFLAADSAPLGVALGNAISNVQSVTNPAGDISYYVVHIDPTGFVVISGDDQLEPVVAFSARNNFDSSDANPLGALLAKT